jgi:hypothetical protein
MTRMSIFAGIDPRSKEPTFALVHPFMANHNPSKLSRSTKHRIGVHVGKRSGRGLPMRDYTQPLIADADTRQVRRAKARATQYAR